MIKIRFYRPNDIGVILEVPYMSLDLVFLKKNEVAFKITI
jgi:hypothetical protein